MWFCGIMVHKKVNSSLRASSPIWASEASIARTHPHVLARLAQIGELARRLG